MSHTAIVRSCRIQQKSCHMYIYIEKHELRYLYTHDKSSHLGACDHGCIAEAEMKDSLTVMDQCI